MKEVINGCDRWIDPLREVMFDVIVADSFKNVNWETVVERIKRARHWLSVALELTRTVDMREYAIVATWLDKLTEKAGDGDREGWDMLIDRVVPNLIDMVFEKYTACITQRKT